MSKVRIQHTRALGYCRKGVKKFFERHNIDWDTFIKEGVPEEALLNTNDALAIKVVENKKKMDGD